MLEQKLIVNRYVNLNIPPAAATRPFAAGAFVPVNAQRCYLEESTGILTKTSVVRMGTSPTAHRNFKWLPWIPGAISEVALVGEDVMTGPMSGCWLVTYRKATGIIYAGHLGTDVANPVATAAVNGAWNAWAAANPGSVIGGFNPFRHWPGAFPVAQPPNDQATRIFGLFTTANQYYIVFCLHQPGPLTLVQIAGIQLVPSVTVARLQQVHTPGP